MNVHLSRFKARRDAGERVDHVRHMRAPLLIAAFLLCAPAAYAQTDAVGDALRGYALYQSDVTALLQTDIDSADAMNTALERGARHDPARLSRGWIAYGAMTAAQSPAFVAGVRSRVRSAGRAPVLRQLDRDLTYARRRPPGANEATQLVLSALAADSARLVAASHRFEGFAESRLGGAWPASPADRDARNVRLHETTSRTLAPELVVRLRTTALAETPLSNPDAFGGARFWDALEHRVSPTPPALPWAVRADRISTLDRMLTLAGLVIVGAEGQDARVNAMLDDQRTRECIAMEQLEFRQCASVAHDASEDAYCLARHGLAETSACFALARAP